LPQARQVRRRSPEVGVDMGFILWAEWFRRLAVPGNGGWHQSFLWLISSSDSISSLDANGNQTARPSGHMEALFLPRNRQIPKKSWPQSNTRPGPVSRFNAYTFHRCRFSNSWTALVTPPSISKRRSRERVSPTALTRMAASSVTGHSCSQIPQPIHNAGST
jgi:hypothetical protein